MLRAPLAAQGGASGSALHAKPASRPQRMPTAVAPPRRRLLASPPTAIDPASLFVAYQAQQFGLTLVGIGAVAALAAAAHLARQRDNSQAYATAAAGPTAAVPAAAASTRDAPAADLLVATMVASQHAAAAPAAVLAAPAVAVPAPVPVGASLSLGDLRAELQQAAAAAVQAVKTAAEGSPAKAPSRASAAQGATPNGSAVMPGMTVQEATRQVQDWISAWRTDEEGEGQDAVQRGAADGASHHTTSAPAHSAPSMPSTSASAVLAEMTADAPVAATQVGAEALDPSLTIGQATGKAGAAQQAPSTPTGKDRAAVTASASASAQKEAALKQSIHVADSKAAAVSGLEAAAAAGTKAKIEGLWANYEQKKAKEAELLAKSDRILQNMAEAEAQEQAQQKNVAVATSQQQHQSVAVVLMSRIVTLLQAVQQFVQQLLAKLIGGGSSNSGAAAGSSA
ncbi:hypothetical protein D9Q98_006021 [Chlorella vulgaris]|uniref:Uncharacterized protein n=1 Tax=Chlorella vulgaris TaxID=3077 RepID=A0A9D4Z0H3_CHLVU|nr:hypothetical protein D9Q98_006021 [Chlorella vulgaris]